MALGSRSHRVRVIGGYLPFVGWVFLLLTYRMRREGSRVTGYDSHLGTVKALLVENPVFELD